VITVVASLGRAGSSLTMKMLSAGGLPVLANKPGSLEHSGMTLLPEYHHWLEDGYAVKINDPHIYTPPSGRDYQFIWLTRDPKQQALSMAKLNLATRPQIERRKPRASIRYKMKFIKKSEPKCEALFKRISRRPVLHITFEELLADPLWCAEQMHEVVDRPLDIDVMAAVVKNRSSDNYPGLMENV